MVVDVISTRNGMAVMAASCILLVTVLSTSSLYLCDDGATDEEVLKMLYDDSFLGGSLTSGGEATHVALSDNTPLPDTATLSLPVYHYGSLDLSDLDCCEEVVDRHFPELDLSNTDIEMVLCDEYQTHYVSISNDSMELRILRNGAFAFRSKEEVLSRCDNIRSKENATEIAMEYLEGHGGVPDDVGSVDAGPLYTIPDVGPILFGKYLVKFSRSFSEYPVLGSMFCNEISITIDATSRKVLEFEWHWPELDQALELTRIPDARSIVEHYLNADDVGTHPNITHSQICYYVPPTIQESAYDTRSDNYYLAPYLAVSFEGGRFYLLGLYFSDKEKIL